MDISDDELEELEDMPVHIAAFGETALTAAVAEEADPQACTEFVEDIYCFLHQSQRRYQAGQFLLHQTDISAHMTGILMDWLVEVAEEYHLNNETLHLAKHYIDRFLAMSKVTRARLQLVGVAAMLIAAKFEEVFPPTVDDFVYISDNTFSRPQVIEMESLMLNTLQFDLTNPTAVEFLQRYSSVSNADVVVIALAKYLTELTLLDYSMAGFLPSHVALTCLVLSNHSQQHHPALHRHLHRLVVESERESIGLCMIAVQKLWVAAPRSKLQAVRVKYERAKHHKVSMFAPPTTWPIL